MNDLVFTLIDWLTPLYVMIIFVIIFIIITVDIKENVEENNIDKKMNL